MAKSLYICYFGVREPLVQTQVIPYLSELVKGGHEISLLTFEGQVAELKSYGVSKLKEELAELGIDWYWLTYHRRFSVLATAWDILCGTVFIWRFIRRERPDILHARVHVPALMAAISRRFIRHKPKILFDIRGFMLEEYTDAGIWPENGWLYRGAKRIEHWLMKESDGFVVLTEAARRILFPESGESGFDKFGRPVEVIPCCVGLERFADLSEDEREAIRSVLGVNGRPILTYVGSFGGWYLSEEMMEFFSAARRFDPSVFILVLTQREKDKIREEFRNLGFKDEDFFVESAKPTEVPKYLNSADLAVSFIKPCFSKISSSPTKIAEYLACGLPIISNKGIGDVDELIQGNGVGVLINGFGEGDYIAALSSANQLGDIGDLCRRVSKSEFDLSNIAGTRYRRLYERLKEQIEKRTRPANEG